MLYLLDENDHNFPPTHLALNDPNGLLAVGGDLSVKRLLCAYKQGIFPWFGEDDPLMWWSPDPRAIVNIEDFRINRTLRKIINKAPYTVTLNHAFEQVINFCADAPFRDDETWIMPNMQAAYLALHKQGHAHSIEVWQRTDEDENELVGGLYGVAINGLFSGESMFYTKPNASKFAFVALAKLLKTINIKFIDCQIINPFLQDMGAIEISRCKFIEHKQNLVSLAIPDDFWKKRTLPLA
jgi:leucyl/phenylalanyl-tRNA--protein transferase